MAQPTVKHQHLQGLAERKVSAHLDLSAALERTAAELERTVAAHKRAAHAEYEWSTACLSLAGLHRDGPDTRRRLPR